MSPEPDEMRLRLHLVVIMVVFVATVTATQDWWRRGFGGFRRVPPRFAKATRFDGTFNFCRLMYTSVRREAGGQGLVHRLPRRRYQLLHPLVRADEDARQP